MTFPRPPSIWTAGAEHIDGGRGTYRRRPWNGQVGRLSLPARTEHPPTENGTLSQQERSNHPERSPLASTAHLFSSLFPFSRKFSQTFLCRSKNYSYFCTVLTHYSQKTLRWRSSCGCAKTTNCRDIFSYLSAAANSNIRHLRTNTRICPYEETAMCRAL